MRIEVPVGADSTANPEHSDACFFILHAVQHELRICRHVIGGSHDRGASKQNLTDLHKIPMPIAASWSD
jgi:hypothetical protein